MAAGTFTSHARYGDWQGNLGAEAQATLRRALELLGPPPLPPREAEQLQRAQLIQLELGLMLAEGGGPRDEAAVHLRAAAEARNGSMAVATAAMAQLCVLAPFVSNEDLPSSSLVWCRRYLEMQQPTAEAHGTSMRALVASMAAQLTAGATATAATLLAGPMDIAVPAVPNTAKSVVETDLGAGSSVPCADLDCGQWGCAHGYCLCPAGRYGRRCLKSLQEEGVSAELDSCVVPHNM